MHQNGAAVPVFSQNKSTPVNKIIRLWEELHQVLCRWIGRLYAQILDILVVFGGGKGKEKIEFVIHLCRSSSGERKEKSTQTKIDFQSRMSAKQAGTFEQQANKSNQTVIRQLKTDFSINVMQTHRLLAKRASRLLVQRREQSNERDKHKEIATTCKCN